MKNLLNNNIGRLRILAFLEGFSLLLLVFIAMPLKYGMEAPMMVKILGPVHGVLFLLFIAFGIFVANDKRWKFFTTFVVLISSFVPFGSFYIDKKILRPQMEQQKARL